MKTKQISNKSKLAGKSLKRCQSANLSPPNGLAVKEQMYASMSGIIPGWLHLCRARFRFIPAKQM